MTSVSRVGKVQTVRGLVAPEHIGVASMHEHLLIDFRLRHVPRAKMETPVPVSLENLFDVLYDPYGNEDNLKMVDVDEAIVELSAFKDAGGSTIVENTTAGLGRDPIGLRKVSEAAGVHISMGAGYYIGQTHPKEMDSYSEAEIYQTIVEEIETGVDGTGIRCGHIGEIGCEEHSPNEMKVVRAAARAQRSTGAMINVHQVTVPGVRDPHAIADEIESVGGDLTRTVFSHIDLRSGEFSLSHQESLLRRGAVLEYDTWGWSSYLGSKDKQLPTDTERLKNLLALIDAGWIGQIVLAQDICMKIQRQSYGGAGYGHILKRVVPRLRKAGLGDPELDVLLLETPQRLLTFIAGQD